MSAHRTEAQSPGLLYLEDSPLYPGHAEISMNFWKELELFTKALSKPSPTFNSQKRQVNSSHYQLLEPRVYKVSGTRTKLMRLIMAGKSKSYAKPSAPF